MFKNHVRLRIDSLAGNESNMPCVCVCLCVLGCSVFVFLSFFASKLNQKVRTVVHLGILEANKRRQNTGCDTKQIFFLYDYVIFYIHQCSLVISAISTRTWYRFVFWRCEKWKFYKGLFVYFGSFNSVLRESKNQTNHKNQFHSDSDEQVWKRLSSVRSKNVQPVCVLAKLCVEHWASAHEDLLIDVLILQRMSQQFKEMPFCSDSFKNPS